MAQRLALIIGNSVYLDGTLSRLLTPDADVGALGELLLDPERGRFDDVKVMVNMSSHIIRRAIASFFAKKTREDLLMLYFSGHGVLDDQGQLFLAVRDTDSRLLSGTAIPASYITTEMNNSRSQRQIIVLDCCHSGAFARGSKGQIGASVGTAATFEGTGYGRVVLTASDATQFAWEGDQVIGKAENSLFTHYLIDGIKTGKADLDLDGQITVDELYDYAYEQVVRQTPKQTPGKWSYKEQGEIVIAAVPSSSVSSGQRLKLPDLEQDQEQALELLYNEGLSAFWLEEWDRAVRCFEAILEVRGDYLDSAKKLELSKRNKRMLALYNQALTAEEAGEWSQVIARLEELESVEPAYKDGAFRLEKARRAQQLSNLYQEARQLSQAEKWQAVVNVFTKIADLQPDYPDHEELLPIARKKVGELERLQKLENLYVRALHELDASNWEKASQILTELDEIETGYKGSDRLLARAKTNLAELQARREREAQLAGLYEQAKALIIAGQWSQALGKMKEIQSLDPGFEDPEKIEARADSEIEHEKEIARRQLESNAKYTQAVQLLQAGQYQQALEQWSQVHELAPDFPDRQKVQATASKKLRELTQVSAPKRRLPSWIYIVAGLAGALILFLIFSYPNWRTKFAQDEKSGLTTAALLTTSHPTAQNTFAVTSVAEVAAIPVKSTPTRTPRPTSTSRPPATKTLVVAPPTAIIFPIGDDFDNPLFNGKYNPELWSIWIEDPAYTITQQDGSMVFSGDNRYPLADIRLHFIPSQGIPFTNPYTMEADYMLDASTYGSHFGPIFGLSDGYAECQVRAWSTDDICCFTHFSDKFIDLPCKTITPGTWHNIRINFMIPNEFDFYIDDDFIGTIRPHNNTSNPIVSGGLGMYIHLLPNTEKIGHGYLDNFIFGPLK